MQYKYRWIYAMLLFLIIVSFGYLYDVKSLLTELDSLKLSKREFLQKLSVQKKANQNQFIDKIQNKQIEYANPLLNLVMLIQKTGLHINELHLTNTNSLINDKYAKIHLLLMGYFQNLIDLLLELHHQRFSILMSNFKIIILDNSKVSFSVDFLLNANQLQPIDAINNTVFGSGLMCSDPHSNKILLYQNNSRLLTTPIEFLKLNGYLQYSDQSTQALIALPNNTTVAIGKGSIVGLERGVVVDIQSDYILLELSNKKQWKIYLNKE